jgi:hypothetical protein
MQTNPTLLSLVVVTQWDGLFLTPEGLNVFEADPGGSQAFVLLELVPVKDFKFEVRPDTRRLK